MVCVLVHLPADSTSILFGSCGGLNRFNLVLCFLDRVPDLHPIRKLVLANDGTDGRTVHGSRYGSIYVR